ncbi:MAG: 8-amino-7-oxononanoate synthase [Alphaproteobacteria bacterium]
MQSLDAFARAKLAALDAGGLRRTLVRTRRLVGPWVERNGRRCLSFSCNDYLNLTHHPAVKAAAVQAIADYGTGAGASRLVTGNHPLMEELEGRLAAFKGTEAACVFSTGYAANTGTIPIFVGEGDLLLVDERAHACIWAGARLSGAQVQFFRHNDLADLERHLESAGAPGAVLIVTEGVFSMDGDIAPLPGLSRLAKRYGAWLMTDDAHGVGVLAEGRGTGALYPDARVDLQMGTLSKALASAGGYVCGSRAAVDLIKTRARTLVYSTGLPPASAAAALAALSIIEADPGLTALPLAKARAFTRAANLAEAQSAIVPVILGEPAAALAAQAALEAEGFLVVGIRPPTVPAGTARLRLAFSAAHPDDEIERLAACIRKLAA